MSQEKVDHYKKQKANRSKIIRREKIKSFFLKLTGSLVMIALVGWVGYSSYKQFYQEVTNTYSIDTAAVDEYLNGLNAAEDEETEAAEETTEAAQETEAQTETEETAAETEAE